MSRIDFIFPQNGRVERLRLRGNPNNCIRLLREKMGEMKIEEDKDALGAAKTFKILEENVWHGQGRTRKR